MKNYKKVEMVAKNAPSGSYAAGCPTKARGGYPVGLVIFCKQHSYCKECERNY